MLTLRERTQEATVTHDVPGQASTMPSSEGTHPGGDASRRQPRPDMDGVRARDALQRALRHHRAPARPALLRRLEQQAHAAPERAGRLPRLQQARSCATLEYQSPKGWILCMHC